MREPLTLEALSELDFRHADDSPPQARQFAEQLQAWATDPVPGDEPTPVHLLLLAGQHFEFGEDLEAAQGAFQQAAELDPDDLQPHVFLACVLITKGEIEQALELDRTIRRARPEDVSAYLLLGEAWHEHGDNLRALGWFNRGLEQAEREDAISEGGFELLCAGRFLVRKAMGHDPDEYDDIALSLIEDYTDSDLSPS